MPSLFEDALQLYRGTNLGHWEPRTDFTALYLDEIASVAAKIGVSCEALKGYVLNHEGRDRHYLLSKPLRQIVSWNLQNCAFILASDLLMKQMTPIDCKRTLLTNAIAAKRMLLDVVPIIEAQTLFDIENPALPQKLPEDVLREHEAHKLITSKLRAAFDISPVETSACYKTLRSIAEKTGSSFFVNYFLDVAFNYSGEADSEQLLGGIPDSYSPSQRLLSLNDSLEVLIEGQILSELPYIKESVSKIGKITTAEQRDELLAPIQRLVARVAAVAGVRHEFFDLDILPYWTTWAVYLQKRLQRVKVPFDERIMNPDYTLSNSAACFFVSQRRTELQLRDDLSEEQKHLVLTAFAASTLLHGFILKNRRIDRCPFGEPPFAICLCAKGGKCGFVQLTDNASKVLDTIYDVELDPLEGIWQDLSSRRALSS